MVNIKRDPNRPPAGYPVKSHERSMKVQCSDTTEDHGLTPRSQASLRIHSQQQDSNIGSTDNKDKKEERKKTTTDANMTKRNTRTKKTSTKTHRQQNKQKKQRKQLRRISAQNSPERLVQCIGVDDIHLFGESGGVRQAERVRLQRLVRNVLQTRPSEGASGMGG